MPGEIEVRSEAVNAILAKIKDGLEAGVDAGQIVLLAEAYAWLSSPGQPHGGNSANGR
jgi:hypothetical protein